MATFPVRKSNTRTTLSSPPAVIECASACGVRVPVLEYRWVRVGLRVRARILPKVFVKIENPSLRLPQANL
jgi:hypothetical protein